MSKGKIKMDPSVRWDDGKSRMRSFFWLLAIGYWLSATERAKPAPGRCSTTVRGSAQRLK